MAEWLWEEANERHFVQTVIWRQQAKENCQRGRTENQQQKNQQKGQVYTD